MDVSLLIRHRLKELGLEQKDLAHRWAPSRLGAGARGDPTFGKLKLNVVPTPGVESTAISPPDRCTKWRTIDSPSPTPLNRLASPRAARK